MKTTKERLTEVWEEIKSVKENVKQCYETGKKNESSSTIENVEYHARMRGQLIALETACSIAGRALVRFERGE